MDEYDESPSDLDSLYNEESYNYEELDDDEYEVESLIKFDAPRNRVCVKWKGYEQLTWEPHEQFKNTPLWIELMNMRNISYR